MTSNDELLKLLNEHNQYINAIDGMLMLLAEGGLSEDQGGYLEVIWSSLEKLKLIENSIKAMEDVTFSIHPKTSPIPKTPIEISDTPLSILVIDDDAVQQLFTTRILEKRGHKVTFAKDGRSGFDLYQNNFFDVIIMDCQLPGIDGFQLTKAIRKYEESAELNTPIIAYTGHTVAGYKQRCFEVGMNDYIKKPVSSAELIEKVEKAVSSQYACVE